MDVSPKAYPNRDRTCFAAAAVIGGRFVGISGDAQTDDKPTVTHAAAAAAPYGVAARDKAIGDDVLVFRDGCLPVEVGTVAVAAGARVVVEADGRVVTVGTAGAGAIVVGTVERAAASGAMALVALAL